MASTETAAAVPAAPHTIRWLTQPEELDDWLRPASTNHPVCLDTEFERVSTFYPIPGLVQLGLHGQFCLVDPAVAEQSERFRALLADPDTPKLLYAMSEDLELFRHWLGLVPKGMIDLQIGAALAGAGFSVGYARLVEAWFGATLDKSATRSDWLARPLSEAQQRYAIDDIRFLAPIHHRVVAELRVRGLESALYEESERFAEELASQDDPERHYLRLRGGWTLSRDRQQVLKALTRWRELECQRCDRPRNRVLSDALLIAIAEQAPASVRALANVQGVPQGIVRRHGEQIVQLVKAACQADSSALELIAPPLTREQQARYKQLKKIFKKVSEESDIPIELLAPRKRLEKLMQDRKLDDSPFFQGWRAALLAPVKQQIEELLDQ